MYGCVDVSWWRTVSAMALPKRHFDEQDFARQLYQEGAMPKKAAEALAGGVGDLASEVREVRQEVNAGFHALNERVGSLGEQTSDVRSGLQEMNAGYQALNERVGSLGEQTSDVKSGLQEMNAGFHALNERVGSLGEQITTVTRGLSLNALLRLTRVSNGKAVLVNPGSVKQITTTRGGRTQVKYQDDSVLVVQETVERIEEMLNP